MNKTIKMIKAVIVSMAILGASMQASASGNSASWKEEVLLHDGKKIVVERSQSYGGYPTIESRERAVLEEEWMFPVPGTGEKLRWKVDQRNPPKGESLMLVLVGFLKGVPYLATSPAGCIAYNHWGRPNPPYVFFKFNGKVWQRIPLTEFPAEFREANVVVGGRMNPQKQAGTTLSIAKIKEDNHLLEPHHRVIVREPITTGDGNWRCPEMVSDGKGGWRSPGGAKAPHPITPPAPVEGQK